MVSPARNSSATISNPPIIAATCVQYASMSLIGHGRLDDWLTTSPKTFSVRATIPIIITAPPLVSYTLIFFSLLPQFFLKLIQSLGDVPDPLRLMLELFSGSVLEVRYVAFDLSHSTFGAVILFRPAGYYVTTYFLISCCMQIMPAFTCTWPVHVHTLHRNYRDSFSFCSLSLIRAIWSSNGFTFSRGRSSRYEM